MLFPAFTLALVLACFTRFMLFISSYVWEPMGNILSALASSLGMIMLVAIIAFTFIFVLIRFGQGFTSNEAYLTFTLPVSIDSHILGRLISAGIFTIISFVAAIACGIIFIPDFVRQFTSLFNQAMQNFSLQISDLPIDIWISIIGLIILTIVGTILFNLLKIYASLGIGSQLTRSNILGGIIGYLILNAIESILTLILLLPMISIFGSTNGEILAYMENLMTDNNLESVRNLLGVVWIFAGVITLINIAFSVVHYFLTRYFYGIKLNCE